MIPKSLSENCKLNNLNKKNIEENRFNIVKAYLNKNKDILFLKKYNFKEIKDLTLSVPNKHIERVNFVVKINGIDYYGINKTIDLLFYIKNTYKSNEVNILSAQTFITKSGLKKVQPFLKNLVEFEEQKFALVPKKTHDIFSSIKHVNSYIKNHTKSLIKTIIPNADYLIDINDNNEIFILEVSELITRYSSKMKKLDSNKISINKNGFKIIDDLFSINLKGSGNHPEYFKICINKKVYKTIEEMRNNSESNRSLAGAKSNKNGKEYEFFIQNNFYIRNNEEINNLSRLFLKLLKIDINNVRTLESFKYSKNNIKPDILVRIELNNKEKYDLNLSVKSSNKNNIGHLSGHTFKSFKRHMNLIQKITKEVDEAFNNFYSIKYANLLSINDKNILSKYFSTNIKELFNFAFIDGNKEEKAEHLVCFNKSKNITNIFLLRKVLNYYLDNNLFDVDFSNKHIYIMNGLIHLEARSSGFQFHFSFKNLVEKLD